jgi:hypothetical protein
MIDMKIDKQLMQPKDVMADVEKNQYSPGLQLRLDKQELSKLEMNELPAVGDYIEIRAMSKVVNVSQNDMMGGDQSGVVLQIEKMEVVKGEQNSSEVAAQKLYGGQ